MGNMPLQVKLVAISYAVGSSIGRNWIFDLSLGNQKITIHKTIAPGQTVTMDTIVFQDSIIGENGQSVSLPIQIKAIESDPTFNDVGNMAGVFAIENPTVEQTYSLPITIREQRMATRSTNGREATLILHFATAAQPTITSITPDTLARGMVTEITVTGQNLPGKPENYTIFRSESQEPEPTIQIIEAMGSGFECKLKIMVSPATAPTTATAYELVTGGATMPLKIKAQGFAQANKFIFPIDYAVATVRYGQRLNPIDGTPQTQVAVLLAKARSTTDAAASLVLTFVPNLDYAALEIPRNGPDRFTDIQLADFVGNDNHILVGISGRTQNNKDDEETNDGEDIISAFEVFAPDTGQTIIKRTPIEAFDAPTPERKLIPNVDGAFIGKVRPGDKKEIMAIVPQTSFLTFTAFMLNSFVYFLYTSEGGTTLKMKAELVNHFDGNPVERSMVTFADFGSKGRKLLVMSKSVMFIFDLVKMRLEKVRQFSDYAGTTEKIKNGNDVPDFPNFTDCNPQLDAQKQCTAQGRRYGQFRLMDVAGKKRLVVAAHSVSGAFPGQAAGNKQGLVPLYTVYNNPLSGTNKSFLAPISKWKKATNVANSHPFRTYYRYFDRAKKKQSLGLKTFANGGLLLRGTPTNGIAFLGDNEAGTPVASLVVSSANNPLDGRVDEPQFEIVSVNDGKTRYTQAGAIAFDVIQASDPNQPARILAWGDLTGKSSYDAGYFQVYRLINGALELVPNMNLDEEPVLLNSDRLNRLPEDFAVSGNAIAIFNAIIESQGRKAFLTSPRGDASCISAYDIDDFTPQLVNASLNGILFAAAAPGSVPLVASDTSQGSTLFVLRTDGSIGLFGVAEENGVWQLMSGPLA